MFLPSIICDHTLYHLSSFTGFLLNYKLWPNLEFLTSIISDHFCVLPLYLLCSYQPTVFDHLYALSPLLPVAILLVLIPPTFIAALYFQTKLSFVTAFYTSSPLSSVTIQCILTNVSYHLTVLCLFTKLSVAITCVLTKLSSMTTLCSYLLTIFDQTLYS